ncbi:MAG: ATP-binding protein [Sedimentisphaerales bacterium]|nr:ATP-binding protein [Sedimentisphaerales bacterium]
MNDLESKSLLNLIYAGETDTLELKTVIREPQLLARLIGSFANGHGGKIIVGVKEPAEIVGVDEERIKRLFEIASQRLMPQIQATLSFHEIEGKKVAIIDIPRSGLVVLADGSAFVRSGTMTQPMAWTQIRDKLPERPDTKTIEALAHSIEKQTKLIEELRGDIRTGNSWKNKWKDYLISGVVGAILGAIATLLMG